MSLQIPDKATILSQTVEKFSKIKQTRKTSRIQFNFHIVQVHIKTKNEILPHEIL